MKYKALLMSPLGLLPAGMPPASAADVPVKAPQVAPFAPLWAGFYAGVNAGVISDHSSQSAFLPTSNGVCWGLDCNFTNSQTSTGLLGGLQLGYNFQTSALVWGIEADLALASARTTKTGTVVATGVNWTSETGVRAIGTARLRIGYAFDRALIYATGGLAYADMKNTHKPNSGAIYAWSERAGWRAGYTVGGGAEYAVNRNWSVKAEALYYDLGSKDHIGVDTLNNVNFGLRDRMTGVIGRIGLNYLFH